MRTQFPPNLLEDKATATSEAAIRKCVHCGFCTATCPTYVLLGDELDSPRGRIYLIKDMLENQRKPTRDVVKHVDRCLSCLACMTTCPSDVNYMHLVDHARAYIETNFRRPLRERLLRWALAWVLTRPSRLRFALRLARPARFAAPLLAKSAALRPLAALLSLVPRRLSPKPSFATIGPRQSKGRIVLLQGCAEQVLNPGVFAATGRVLSRLGYEVAFARGEGCCGALAHHMGRQKQSLGAARRNIDVWLGEIEGKGIDAIVVTASGCGTTMKDYGFMLQDDPAYAAKARRVSGLVRDISELLGEIGLPALPARGLAVAYHSACSLQHGQKIDRLPRQLLERAGFVVRTPAEAHLCCGSAGTYNILQPELAGQLGARKAANLEKLDADMIVASNIGCAVQIGARTGLPVVHLVELIDWATGGPEPEAIGGRLAGTMGLKVRAVDLENLKSPWIF